MKLAGVGYSDVDQLVLVDKMPNSGEHPRVLETSWQCGGPVSTALAAAARLGQQCSLFCTIGGAGGRFVRDDLLRHGVNCDGLVDIPGRESWMYLCVSDMERCGRSFFDLRTQYAVPYIRPEMLKRDLLLENDWLLVCDKSDAASAAVAWFSEAKKTIVMDADCSSDPWKMLPFIHHLILCEDLYHREFGNGEDYETGLRAFHIRQPSVQSVTVVTLGARGCVGIDEKGRVFRLPAYNVKAVDTTGAGDVFHGAYIAGRFEGMDAVEACRMASAASAFKCLKMGGRAGIPNRAQLREFMGNGRMKFEEIEKRVSFYRDNPFTGTALPERTKT